MYRSIQDEEKKRQIMSEFFVPGAIQAQEQLTEHEWSTNRSVVVDGDNGLWHLVPETPLPPTPEDESDIPTLKRIPALPRQTSFLPTPEDVSDIPTLKRVAALPKQASFLP